MTAFDRARYSEYELLEEALGDLVEETHELRQELARDGATLSAVDKLDEAKWAISGARDAVSAYLRGRAALSVADYVKAWTEPTERVDLSPQLVSAFQQMLKDLARMDSEVAK